MRMTIDLANDVIEDAKLIAEDERKSLDEFVADLVRQRVEKQLAPTRNGVPLIKRHATGRTVTPEFVIELSDQD